MRRCNSSKGTIGTCSCFEFGPIGANRAACLPAFEMADTKDPVMKAELTSHSCAGRKSCCYQLPRSELENQSVKGSPLPKVLTDICQIQLWVRAHKTREALTQSWTESLAGPAGHNPSPENCLTSEQLRAEMFITAPTRLKWRSLWMRFF